RAVTSRPPLARSVPCSAAPRAPPPFPPRRSSDLFSAHAPTSAPESLPASAPALPSAAPPPASSPPAAPASLADTSPETRGTSWRSEEHTSELQSREHLVCRLPLEKKEQ